MLFETEKQILRNGNEVILAPANVIDPVKYMEYAASVASETPFTGNTPETTPQTVEVASAVLEYLANDQNSISVFCIFGDVIIGYANVLRRQNPLQVHRATVTVEVSKAYWNSGIGRMLLSKVINFGRVLLGVQQLELEVNTNNFRAINLYKSFGFVTVGEIANTERLPDGTRMDSYIMIQ